MEIGPCEARERKARAVVTGPRLPGDVVWVPSAYWARAMRLSRGRAHAQPPMGTEHGLDRADWQSPSAVSARVRRREVVGRDPWLCVERTTCARDHAWVRESAVDPAVGPTLASAEHASAADVECDRAHCGDAIHDWETRHREAMHRACTDAAARRCAARVDTAVASIAVSIANLSEIANAVSFRSEDRHLLLQHVLPVTQAAELGPVVQELLADCVAQRVFRTWTARAYGGRPSRTAGDDPEKLCAAQDAITRSAHDWVRGTGAARVYGGLTLVLAERGESPWDILDAIQ